MLAEYVEGYIEEEEEEEGGKEGDPSGKADFG